jgi:hypothetical protein
VNTMINLRVSQRKQATVWQAEWLSAFQRISCTMEWVGKWVSK